MNLNEVKKHVYIDILIIVFTIVSFLFTLYVILFQDINVNASTVETNLTSSISIPPSYSGCSQSNGKYWGDDGTSTTCHVWNKNTTYSGVLYSIEMVLKGGWVVNEPAFINITAMSTDFRNNDLYCTIENQSGTSLPCSLSFNSKSLLTISFTPTSAQQNYVLGIYSGTFSAITGINSFGIKSVISKQYTGDNSDVINNQNQNTQDIIDSNNSNTQDIIENANYNNIMLIDKSVENMLAELNQQRSELIQNCSNAYNTPLKIGKTLNNSGQLVDSDGGYYTEDYINIDFISGTKTRLYIENPPQSIVGFNVIAYDSNKNYLGRVPTATRSWSFPSGTQYFRFSSPVSNTIISANSKCLTYSQETNDYLKDDSDPTINNNDIANTFNSVSVSDPLNYLLTLPLHAIQKINAKLGSNSCSPINLGALYGHNLTLPCINIKAKLGDSLFNTIDILMAIGLLSVTLVKFYNSISNVLTLGKEKEIRERLELPTPMEFLGMLFGGARQ